MITALLVEDDIDLAQTVVEYLALEDIQCDHATNGVAGLQLLTTHHYQVLLLDLNLPTLDGLTLCQTIRERGDDTPVLMLTARDMLEDKLAGFAVGTDDYLVKPFALPELVARTQALAHRRSGQIQRLQVANLCMDLGTHQVSRDGHPIKLSPTGWALLECLMRAAPTSVSREQLQQAVWGDEWPDSNALKVHIHHLRKAIDLAGETPLVKTVPGYGFALRADDD